MKLPNKFWFYHKSDSSEIFFARKMGNDYFVSNSKKETFARFEHEVEEYFNLGYWVLTVPDKFCVRGLLTGRMYSVIKDANGLYALKNRELEDVSFYLHEEVLDRIYGADPLWEIVEDASLDFNLQ